MRAAQNLPAWTLCSLPQSRGLMLSRLNLQSSGWTRSHTASSSGPARLGTWAHARARAQEQRSSCTRMLRTGSWNLRGFFTSLSGSVVLQTLVEVYLHEAVLIPGCLAALAAAAPLASTRLRQRKLRTLQCATLTGTHAQAASPFVAGRKAARKNLRRT